MLVPALEVATASVSDGGAVYFEEPGPPIGLQAPHSGAYLGIGQAVADVDHDGWPDLYLTTAQGPNTLLVNQAGAGFVPAAHSEVLALTGHDSAGALFLDYDNDGWPDLLVLGMGSSHLFRNLQGNGWQEVTVSVGLVTAGQGQSAAAADFDGDGWTDLYVVHWYFDDDETSPLREDRLFRNDRGLFVDVSQWVGTHALSGPGFAAVWTDVNDDGRPDLYVVNDKLYGNVLLRNDGLGCGGWCFTDVSWSTGAARPAYSMGIAVGDPDLDGDFDFYYSSIGEQVLLENGIEQGSLVFHDRSDAAGVNYDAVGWGAVFFDADNDGFEDLYLAVSNSDQVRCNRFWHGQGDGSFIDLSALSGLDDCGFGMGLATLDLDLDGRLDLVLGNWNDRFVLFRNLSPAANWLQLGLNGGDRVNRDAIGTRVRLADSSGRIQTRELRRGSGHGGNHEPVLHFGMADSQLLWLELRWPDGVTTRLDAPPPNQRLVLTHPHHGGIVFQADFEN